jgi:hypothetical protein
MRAGAGWALSVGAAAAATAADAVKASSQRCRFIDSLLGGRAAESLFAQDNRAFAKR